MNLEATAELISEDIQEWPSGRLTGSANEAETNEPLFCDNEEVMEAFYSVTQASL